MSPEVRLRMQVLRVRSEEEMTERPTIDEIGMHLAEVWSQRSTCSRRQVGAVVMKNGYTVSSGYNGVPSGQEHCVDGGCPRGQLTYEECPAYSSYNDNPCHAVHAEANAIMQATPDQRDGATLYVTHEPCHQCTSLILNSGITDVYYYSEE